MSESEGPSAQRGKQGVRSDDPSNQRGPFE